VQNPEELEEIEEAREVEDEERVKKIREIEYRSVGRIDFWRRGRYPPGVFCGCMSKERGRGRECAHLCERKGDERNLLGDGGRGAEARGDCSNGF